MIIRLFFFFRVVVGFLVNGVYVIIWWEIGVFGRFSESWVSIVLKSDS